MSIDGSGSVGTPLVDGIRRSALLHGLPEEDLTAVLGACRVLRRDRGQRLLRSGGDAVLIVLQGAAKEHRAVSQVDEVVLALLGAGDVAGLTGALGTPCAGDVTALTDAAALLMPGGELRSLARERPAVAQAWLQTAVAELGDLRRQVLAFSTMSTTGRVVYRLVELAERFGEPIDGEVRIRAQLTQEELASWARASRESVARALHELRRARIIMTRRRSLTILDLEALRQRLPCADQHAVSEPLLSPRVVAGFPEVLDVDLR